MAWVQRSGVGTREAPASRAVRLKEESREGQAWPAWVAEEAGSSEDARNERRAKGPQFQGNATSGARAEIGASLPPADKLWKLQETLHAQAKGVTTRGRKHEITLVRKPDAGNPHVRFDERGSGNGSAKGNRATPRLYLPSEATSCNSRSDARQGRTRSAPGAWQVSGLMNGTIQVRAPLRGSARRAAGVNPPRAWPG